MWVATADVVDVISLSAGNRIPTAGVVPIFVVRQVTVENLGRTLTDAVDGRVVTAAVTVEIDA